MEYKPDGKEGTCQCVRDHATLIDGTIYQCSNTPAPYNGLCEGCWQTHGEAMQAKTNAQVSVNA